MIRKNYLFWGATFLGLLLDRVTKLWVVTSFDLTTPPQTLALIPGVFHFTFVINTGAAFSLFQGEIWLRWISLGVSLGLVYTGLFVKNLSPWDQVGLGFLLSGAAGNGLDRFLEGHVVDFLDFRLIQFPVFNIADVFINLGLICLLIGTWITPSKKRNSKRPSPPHPPSDQ
ncbi:signal peptidase II [Lyngbya confervoides]|uniref:Lipoprotein signal peptidase n=1 Tax=Lyngbya confervoides BDU141951 TaxID=1574623 RepID=A0ABD4T472_9CYAN|nr:signal peptidase II [Lyngbya confervoides]MCM1983493.1 signal peptidase II [Lyngbya confervoides BDU141951]